MNHFVLVLVIAVLSALHFNFSLTHAADAPAIAMETVTSIQQQGIEHLKGGDIEKALECFSKAAQLTNYCSPNVLTKYVEILLQSKNYDRAIDASKLGLDCSQEDTSWIEFYAMAAFLFQEIGDLKTEVEMFIKIVNIDPQQYHIWRGAGEALVNNGEAEQAEILLQEAVKVFPNDYFLRYMYATSFHLQVKLEEALEQYRFSMELNSTFYHTQSNIGALYQQIGNVDMAFEYYSIALPHLTDDVSFVNNYGSFLGYIGKEEEQLKYLERALQLQPNLEEALVNLAGHYQEEGDLERAREYIARILGGKHPKGPHKLRVRLAVMISPISRSWAQMVEERLQIRYSLALLNSPSEVVAKKEPLDVDCKPNFYVPYHGLNDRWLQEAVTAVYDKTISDVNYIRPAIQHLASPMQVQNSLLPFLQPKLLLSPEKFKRKVRIAVMSKFFGLFEPHGLLLDGILRYLPRSQYHVIALPVAKGDIKPISPSILESVDEVLEVSLSFTHGLKLLEQLELDILIYADSVSEPMTHFLCRNRVAPIQLLFWGNPITSGSHHIDYFISSDAMEFPYRTRMRPEDEPYTEQVVLLEGQGIWYVRPPSPEEELKRSHLDQLITSIPEIARSEFAFEDSWFLFLMPQSVFKIHPEYDRILAQILAATPKHCHIAVTGGRRQRWTEIYTERLLSVLREEDRGRLHVINRVSSEKFNNLLRISDAILHPFPFDGSKTSADALNMNIPFVTLPSEHLRGRMGMQFLRTMNVPELVAKNASHYVAIAGQLCEDVGFFRRMQEAVAARAHLIWEDMQQPYEWYRLLNGVMGLSQLSFEGFLAQTGRNAAEDLRLHQIREENRRLFDLRWGEERHLLVDGRSHLESMIEDPAVLPRIFTDWHRDQQPASTEPRYYFQPQRASVVEEEDDEDFFLAEEEERAPVRVEVSRYTSAEVEILQEFWKNAKGGEHQVALTQIYGLYKSHPTDAFLMMEVGLLLYLMGDYQGSFDFCSEAAAVVPDCVVVHVCVGAAGIYLKKEESSVLSAFRKAWQLTDDIEKRRAANSSSQLEEKEQHVMQSGFFLTSRPIIEYNLMAAATTYGHCDQGLNLLSELYGLPPLHLGGGYVLIFSLFRWSKERKANIDELEEMLRKNSMLQLAAPQTLFQEIRRFQKAAHALITPAVECLESLADSDMYAGILQDLLYIASLGESSLPPLTVRDHLDPSEPPSGVVLVTQYFQSEENETLADVNMALVENLSNFAIRDIVLLTEREYDFSQFPNSGKIMQVVIGKRMTFQDGFAYANQHLRGRTVVLANSDIYFDSTLQRLGNPDALKLGNTVLSLLRWSEEEEQLSISLRIDSQDAWIFQPPMREEVVESSNFYLGAARCDNRLAYLLKQAKYSVINAPLAIHAIEKQLGRHKRRERLETSGAVGRYELKDAVQGTGSDVFLSDKFLFGN